MSGADTDLLEDRINGEAERGDDWEEKILDAIDSACSYNFV